MAGRPGACWRSGGRRHPGLGGRRALPGGLSWGSAGGDPSPGRPGRAADTVANAGEVQPGTSLQGLEHRRVLTWRLENDAVTPSCAPPRHDPLVCVLVPLGEPFFHHANQRGRLLNGAPIGACWSGLQLSRVTPRSSVAPPHARATTSTSGERTGENAGTKPGVLIGSLRGRKGRRDPERTGRPFNAGDPLFYRRPWGARPFYTQHAERARESVKTGEPERRDRVSRR